MCDHTCLPPPYSFLSFEVTFIYHAYAFAYEKAMPIAIKTPDTGRHMQASLAIVDGIISKQIEGGIRSTRIVLGGFSQGAALSLAATLKCKHKLGGCIVLSGWALHAQKLGTVAATSISKDRPFLICHGIADGVVLIENAQHVTEILGAAGVKNATVKFL